MCICKHERGNILSFKHLKKEENTFLQIVIIEV